MRHEQTFNVFLERDEDEFYVASVVELPGCHTQARTLDLLQKRVREAISAYLQVSKPVRGTEFVGMQQMRVSSHKS